MLRHRHAVALGMCLALAWLSPSRAAAQPSGDKPVIVGGLRPTSDASHGATEITRLPEAQAAREVIDDVVKEIAQRPVLNHAALRAKLGSAYMVDLFNCNSQLKCIVGAFGALRSDATYVVYGDYAPQKKKYVVRLRLIDLATGNLLAEDEFLVPVDQLTDRDRWKKSLTTLFAAVPASGGETGGGETGGGETGGGETGGGETGGGETGGGETGGGETGGGETGGGETGGNAEELTDADFGETVTSVAVEAQRRRDDVPWIELGSTISMTAREFEFKAAPDNEVLRPDPFTGSWTVKAGGQGELYPLTALGKTGRMSQLGLLGGYARSDTSSDGGRETELHAGLAYRVPVGDTPTHPTFKVLAQFVRHDFVIMEDDVSFPSVSYRGGSIGADARVPVLTPRLAFLASASTMFVLARGEMGTKSSYGPSRAGGLEASAAIEVRPLSFLFLRVGARYTRYFLEYDGDGDLSSLGAVGGSDRFLTATVMTGVVR